MSEYCCVKTHLRWKYYSGLYDARTSLLDKYLGVHKSSGHKNESSVERARTIQLKIMHHLVGEDTWSKKMNLLVDENEHMLKEDQSSGMLRGRGFPQW